MTSMRNFTMTLLLGTMLGTFALAAPARAQDAEEATSEESAAPVATGETAPAPAPTVTEASNPAAPAVTETPKPAAPANAAPTPVMAPAATPAVPDAPKPPEPPKPTGPVYNPPPPSGKDWGKLPQESREQILNDWKGLPEKDREPFIFYRERAMAKLPDSAFSDNPYKPDPDAGKAAPGAAAASPAVAPAASPAATSQPSLLDRLMGKGDGESAE